MSGLDIRFELGEGHPLFGRRMPDLDLVTADDPVRVFELLHDARPVLLNLGEPGAFDIAPWANRLKAIDARYGVRGSFRSSARGHRSCCRADSTRRPRCLDRCPATPGLRDAPTRWFGPPAAAASSRS